MAFKICHVSDTHMSHWELKMPDADILVHTGDFSGCTNQQELIEFNKWLGSLEGKYREIFFVPGNHDGQFEYLEYAESILTNAIVLFDKEYIFDGHKIYGSPWTLEFFDWWFMKKPHEMKPVWDKIPDDTSILLTHQPPHLILDTAIALRNRDKLVSVGCKELRHTVMTRLKKLKLHCFGHLHWDGGKWIEENGIIFSNGSINDDYYAASRQPMLIEL